MESIRGKRAWITGASSGIGRATARPLSGAGAEVVLSARRLKELEALAGEIRNEGGRAIVKPLEVTDKAAVINDNFLANVVLTTDEAVKAMG